MYIAVDTLLRLQLQLPFAGQLRFAEAAAVERKLMIVRV